MNTHLNSLQPYPFQKLKALFNEISPNLHYPPINLSIGEPKHATPRLICEALTNSLTELAIYPTTQGSQALRNTLAEWLVQRYKLNALDPNTQVLPVNGSREALFAFAQAVVDSARHPTPIVITPNPFYQIYEGAALLAGASPYYIGAHAENQFQPAWEAVAPEIWRQTQLVYVCSPNNPTGAVTPLSDWKTLFELSDQYGFIIASDECYSEIYFNETNPPLGALQAANQLGRTNYKNLVTFSSLSKRSNVPGLRSGFVAGDAAVLEKFLLYRTYQGCAMSPVVQAASIAAWRDEAHVIENRRLYKEKFSTVTPILQQILKVTQPEAGFYLWAQTPTDDEAFALGLYRDYNVTVLPGSYLSRVVNGENPGKNFIRIALVAPLAECMDAATRICDFIKKR